VDREAVGRWLTAYVEAWKTYDPARIAALFSDDVAYRYHPYDEPVQGRDAIVEAWLGEANQPGASTRDEEGTFDPSYHVLAVDGDIAVVTGTTSYRAEPGGQIDRIYDNCFVIRFDSDGRCREFTEWYMKRP
jgi:ketosteroid isomerase-like protein